MLSRRGLFRASGLLGAAALPWLVGCTTDDNGAPAVELVPGEDLYAVRFSCSGGESGGYERVGLERDERGGAVLEWSSREWYKAREKKGKAKLEASSFDEFVRLVDEYDLRAASEQPDSGLVALDADTSSITFAYVGEDGGMDADNMFSIDEWKELTDEQREGFWAAIAALKALVPQD